MFRTFCFKFSLEAGVNFILWMNLAYGIITMLSPSNNVKFTTMYPPEEFWKAAEKMQESWRENMKMLKNMTNTTAITDEPTPVPTTQQPLFPRQFPEPGSVASEVSFGVSWMNIPLGFIQTLVSGMALYGVYEEKKAKYLFPYLTWSVVYPLINVLSNIFTGNGFFMIGFLIAIFHIGFYLYCVAVIYSYYIQLKSKTRSYKAPSFA